MTKTFIPLVSHCFANPGLTEMMAFGTILDGPFVWNLLFGAWNFHDFLFQQVICEKSFYYLLK